MVHDVPQPRAAPLLRARDLRHRYGCGEAAVTVLHGIDLDVHAGEFLAIVGGSGSGKSTLMNLLGALDRPHAGDIEYAGQPLHALTGAQLAELRSRQFGFVFQRYHLIEGLDAIGNVILPAIYAGRSRQARTRAQALLARLGLAGREAHAPHQLSGGQCQRVAIARALINDPRIIFADEPTGALDSASGTAVLDILEALVAEGRSVVMVTHDAALAERADRIIEIRDGRIVAERRPQRSERAGHAPARDPSPAMADGARVAQPVEASRETPRNSEPRMAADPGIVLASLSMAWRSLWRHRLRSLLTLSGVLIGVAAVVALLGIGQGAREQVIEQVTALGSNLLEVRAGARNLRGSGGERARLDETTLAMIRELDGVYALSPEPYAAQTVRHGDKDGIVTVQGVAAEWPEVRAWDVASGAFFDRQHVDSFAQVAVLGATTAARLFAADQDPVGAVILIGSQPFRVIAVMQASGVTTGGGRHDRDDQIWVPYTTANARLFTTAGFDRIVLRVADTADPVELERIIEQRLALRHSPESFHLRNQAEALALRSAAQDTLTRLLAAIAAIALTVGGIGVMNIMLVSVTERVGEIGLRIAVGARERDVLLQFLIEAVLVCLVGGLLGVLIGLGAGTVVAGSSDWRMVYSWPPVLAALSAAVLTGLLSGLWPALQAARLNPVQALSGGR